MSADFEDLRRLRRGVGVVYLLAGLLHWAEMTLALLIATHRIAVTLSPRQWSQLFFGHFLILIFSGSLYLMFSYYRSGIFTFPALVDYIAGVPVFMIGFPIAGMAMLALLHLHPRASVIVGYLPGAFLVAYGLGLRSGRAMGFFTKLPD